ncbi:hypothetical protein ASF17_04085 [Frigoribacterium sp. Leaf263]|nr:hypothetical protein ASF17_04085 [Frigoribacterium sp. Leaf263]KQR65003.1 hypothetical protein ASF89_11530 [Frigoribacterium sp. Leaf172]
MLPHPQGWRGARCRSSSDVDLGRCQRFFTFDTASSEWLTPSRLSFLSARFSLSERTAVLAVPFFADFSAMVVPPYLDLDGPVAGA